MGMENWRFQTNSW